MCCDGAANSSSRNSSAVGGRTGACAQPASSKQTMIVRLRMATKLYAWAMFRPNALKARLRTGKRALGCWTVLGAPPVIELLALCGFDYLLLDQEHGFGEPPALLGAGIGAGIGLWNQCVPVQAGGGRRAADRLPDRVAQGSGEHRGDRRG